MAVVVAEASVATNARDAINNIEIRVRTDSGIEHRDIGVNPLVAAVDLCRRVLVIIDPVDSRWKSLPKGMDLLVGHYLLHPWVVTHIVNLVFGDHRGKSIEDLIVDLGDSDVGRLRGDGIGRTLRTTRAGFEDHDEVILDTLAAARTSAGIFFLLVL